MRWTLAIAALSALALCACGAVCNPVPAVNSSVAAPTGLSVSISNGNQATVKWSGAAAATQVNVRSVAEIFTGAFPGRCFRVPALRLATFLVVWRVMARRR